MAAKLDGTSELPAQNPQMASAPLRRLINIGLLGERHQELGGEKAAGADHAAKAGCGAGLGENLNSLAERLKRKSYKPQPPLRACMPKADGKPRPPGMAACEGKLAQFAPERVLEAAYEPKLRGRMFGFRPRLGCRGALKEPSRLIGYGRAGCIADAGAEGFFSNMERGRILEPMRFRISGPNILRPIKKTPAAGAVEGGKWRASGKGSEQGSLAPPTVANICMRCALAQWFDIAFKRQPCGGECGLAACAGDSAAAFQRKDGAERFLKAIADGFALFGLELERAKTRLAEFGGFAGENLKRRRQGKPETFDFLGSAHCRSKSKNGKFRAERKTARGKLRLELAEMNIWAERSRHLPLKDLFFMISLKLRGRCQCCGIADNCRQLGSFGYFAKRMLFKRPDRRSRKKSCAWDGFEQMLKIFPLVLPRIHVNIYS
ncbi:MAG: group II intron reverse transcriptase/maturase [Clostridiales bacterium]|jgi:hypothetical protein|nr:group II intron reverse transcriptase/maturase [Clostridiales bacterium]